VVQENPWKVVSLLATCRKKKQGGDEGEREDGEGLGCVSFFPLFWKVVSLLATCHKEKQGGDEGERRERG
jgi:3-dehydroquinate dehydratase